MHVLGKQLPHSGVEGVERMGMRGISLIMLAFLIKIIIAQTQKSLYDEKTTCKLPRGGQIPITWTYRRSSSDANTVFYVGKQSLTNETKDPREILVGDMFYLVLFRYTI